MNFRDFDDDIRTASIILNNFDQRLQLELASPKVWTKEQIKDLRTLWSLSAMLLEAVKDLDTRRPG